MDHFVEILKITIYRKICLKLTTPNCVSTFNHSTEKYRLFFQYSGWTEALRVITPLAECGGLQYIMLRDYAILLTLIAWRALPDRKDSFRATERGHTPTTIRIGLVDTNTFVMADTGEPEHVNTIVETSSPSRIATYSCH